MSDFRTIVGFEDVWRPPVQPHRRTPQNMQGSVGGFHAADVRARLVRLCTRAPEVVVKVAGCARDPSRLRAHLDYISRNGRVQLEDRDGAVLTGRPEVKDLAEDWSLIALSDRRRRLNSPITLAIILSMPAGANPSKVREAACAFANRVFAGEHDYVFALHTDASHPHVHMAVCSRGDNGARLNPKKADLEHWRQVFAQALRDRGVEAEATPRRARGVTRKPERSPLRQIRKRHEAGLGEISQVQRAAYHDAAMATFRGDVALRPWELQTAKRQAVLRKLYLDQARVLAASADKLDRELAGRVLAFVVAMPQPDSQRLALARELRRASGEQVRNAKDTERHRER